jgi:lysophospholipase L1-like esterase
LLEITLRIIGFIHEKKHHKNQNIIVQNTNPVIICAGDSFTESFGATFDNDYPSQLSRLLETNDSICSFNVLNFGKSGKNSAQILLEVPVYLEKHKPKFLILLIGSANYWNYWGYRGKDKVWDRLKTVQFFKLLFNNMSYRKNRNYFNQYDYIQRRMTYSNYGIDTNTNTCNNKTLKILKSAKEEQILLYVDSLVNNNLLSDSVALDLILYGIFSGQKIEGMGDYLENYEPSSERAKFYYNFIKSFMCDLDINLSSISKPYAALYIYLDELKEKKFTEENLRKCLEYDPYFEDAYYQLYLISEDKLSTPEDFLAKGWSFNDTMEFYKHRYGLSEANLNFCDVYISEDNSAKTKIKESNVWVKDDLIKIYNMCQENGTLLVLMNYPILHQGAIYYPVNGVIRDFANKEELFFVDNEFIFDTIENNRNSYFISDGHCSDKGYELMARNIFNVLLNNHLISIDEACNGK